MNPKSKGSFILLPLLLCACLLLCSCGNTTDTENGSNPQTSATAADNSSPAAASGSRDNTPVVLTGSADSTVTYGNDSVTIDASHTENGYLMVSYSGSNPKVKLQITGSDEITYTYNLHDGYETFPLTSGNGSYTVGVFENMEGTSYSTLFTQTLDVTIQDEFGPYLYANQYVNFTAQSKTVAKAVELSSSANDDLEVIENVYNYIITNFTYDYDKAASVQSGYLPDVDDVLAKQTGICFDYAAVMAAMLRCERIPTRLEVGYMGDVYHAWISTYIKDKGWVNGIIEFDGNDWKLMDPTFASTSSDPKDFLTQTDEYITKYVY
jgi:hypothetical protein